MYVGERARDTEVQKKKQEKRHEHEEETRKKGMSTNPPHHLDLKSYRYKRKKKSSKRVESETTHSMQRRLISKNTGAMMVVCISAMI